MATKTAAAKTAKPVAQAAAKTAPVAKKAPIAKKVAAKKAPAVKRASKASAATLVSPLGEVAFKQIEQEAYFLAERDGFSKDPLTYWSQAEVKLGMRKA
ncbi:MAG: hypothetical protein ACNA71_04065 [Kiritimatiellia bacterium]